MLRFFLLLLVVIMIAGIEQFMGGGDMSISS